MASTALPKRGDFVVFKATQVLGCVVRSHEAEGIDVDVGPDVAASAAIGGNVAATSVDAATVINARTVRVASAVWTVVLSPLGVAEQAITDVKLVDVPGSDPAARAAAAKRYTESMKRISHSGDGAASASSPAASPLGSPQRAEGVDRGALLTLSESINVNLGGSAVAISTPELSCPPVNYWLWHLVIGPLYGLYWWHHPAACLGFLYCAWLLQTWATSGVAHTQALVSVVRWIVGAPTAGISATAANFSVPAVPKTSLTDGTATPSSATVDLVLNVVRLIALLLALSATPLHEADLATDHSAAAASKESDTSSSSSRRHSQQHPRSHWIVRTTESFAASMKLEFRVRLVVFAAYGAISAYCSAPSSETAGAASCPGSAPAWVQMAHEMAVAPVGLWDFCVTQLAQGVVFSGLSVLTEARRRASVKPKPRTQ